MVDKQLTYGGHTQGKHKSRAEKVWRHRPSALEADTKLTHSGQSAETGDASEAESRRTRGGHMVDKLREHIAAAASLFF